MFRKIAAAMVAATVLLAPVLAVEAAAATPPETVKPGKVTTSKLKASKVKPSKVKPSKLATSFKAKTAKKPAKLAAASGKKQFMATKKSKQQATLLRAKTKAPAEHTGSVAPRSVPTPGLY